MGILQEHKTKLPLPSLRTLTCDIWFFNVIPMAEKHELTIEIIHLEPMR